MAGQLKLSSRGAKNRVTNRPPLLFGLIFNALLLALRATLVRFRTVSGLWSPARGFVDDLVLITRSCGDMSLLEAVAGFCAWSGMRIKREKSVITGFDYKERASLPTESILYEGEPLTGLSADEAFAYLGVRASLASRFSPSPPSACEGKNGTKLCIFSQVKMQWFALQVVSRKVYLQKKKNSGIWRSLFFKISVFFREEVHIF
jgi:hypothetical protein